jgi:hypothetical protein
MGQSSILPCAHSRSRKCGNCIQNARKITEVALSTLQNLSEVYKGKMYFRFKVNPAHLKLGESGSC